MSSEANDAFPSPTDLVSKDRSAPAEYPEWQEYPLLTEPLHVRLERLFTPELVCNPYYQLRDSGKLTRDAGWHALDPITVCGEILTENRYCFGEDNIFFEFARHDEDGKMANYVTLAYGHPVHAHKDQPYALRMMTLQEGGLGSSDYGVDLSESQVVRKINIRLFGDIKVSDTRYRQGWTTTREDGKAWIGYLIEDGIDEDTFLEDRRLASKWKWDDARRDYSYRRYFSYTLVDPVQCPQWSYDPKPLAGHGFITKDDRIPFDMRTACYSLSRFNFGQVRFTPDEGSPDTPERQAQRVQQILGIKDNDAQILTDGKKFTTYVRKQVMSPIPFPRYTTVQGNIYNRFKHIADVCPYPRVTSAFSSHSAE